MYMRIEVREKEIKIKIITGRARLMTAVLVNMTTVVACCFRTVGYSWDCRDFAVYRVMFTSHCVIELCWVSVLSHKSGGKLPLTYFLPIYTATTFPAAKPHRPWLVTNNEYNDIASVCMTCPGLLLDM